MQARLSTALNTRLTTCAEHQGIATERHNPACQETQRQAAIFQRNTGVASSNAAPGMV